jgi:hypothetical protein
MPPPFSESFLPLNEFMSTSQPLMDPVSACLQHVVEKTSFAGKDDLESSRRESSRRPGNFQRGTIRNYQRTWDNYAAGAPCPL